MSDRELDSPKESPPTRQTEQDRGLSKFEEPQSKKLRSSFDKDGDTMQKSIPKDKPEKSKTTFKALGNVVLAMKRFQASLNPTYTYGKHVVCDYFALFINSIHTKHDIISRSLQPRHPVLEGWKPLEAVVNTLFLIGAIVLTCSYEDFLT